MARTIEPLNRIGRSFITHLPILSKVDPGTPDERDERKPDDQQLAKLVQPLHDTTPSSEKESLGGGKENTAEAP